MAKIEKLIRKLLANPKDLTWEELKKILSHFGYEEIKTAGSSSRKFLDDKKNLISGLHKPHSNDRLKTYQIKIVIEHLKEIGKLNND